MDRSEPEKRLGEMTVELEELSAICREEEDPSANINLAVSTRPLTALPWMQLILDQLIIIITCATNGIVGNNIIIVITLISQE